MMVLRGKKKTRLQFAHKLKKKTRRTLKFLHFGDTGKTPPGSVKNGDKNKTGWSEKGRHERSKETIRGKPNPKHGATKASWKVEKRPRGRD